MVRTVLALALVASSVIIGGISTSSGASAAGYCESAPPQKKFICCQKHPRAAACR